MHGLTLKEIMSRTVEVSNERDARLLYECIAKANTKAFLQFIARMISGAFNQSDSIKVLVSKLEPRLNVLRNEAEGIKDMTCLIKGVADLTFVDSEYSSRCSPAKWLAVAHSNIMEYILEDQAENGNKCPFTNYDIFHLQGYSDEDVARWKVAWYMDMDGLDISTTDQEVYHMEGDSEDGSEP